MRAEQAEAAVAALQQRIDCMPTVRTPAFTAQDAESAVFIAFLIFIIIFIFTIITIIKCYSFIIIIELLFILGAKIASFYLFDSFCFCDISVKRRGGSDGAAAQRSSRHTSPVQGSGPLNTSFDVMVRQLPSQSLRSCRPSCSRFICVFFCFYIYLFVA
jgi:hypothetical protein